MNQQRLYYLVEKFMVNQLTVEEQQDLYGLLQNAEHYPAVLAAFETLGGDVYASEEVDETLLPLIQQATLADKFERIEQAPVRHISFIRKWGWAAAAILIMISAGIYFWSSNILVNRHPPISQVQQEVDVAPGRDGAVLRLADGSNIVLDSLGNGTIANQNGTDVVLKDGQLLYEAGAVRKNAPQQWNTMFTPKGRQFNVTLPDGTHVWLNAASSITYPTAFTGRERIVQLKGEAYFEVAKDKTKPFHVQFAHGSAHEYDLEVLGTHFNVNAYGDEPVASATLLEGKVKVGSRQTPRGRGGLANRKEQSVVLKPGEQAIAKASPLTTHHSPFTIDHTPDIDKVMAWRNGAFNFEGASLQEVMRQLARWYDIEIVYEKDIPDIHFMGEMSRDISLAGVLKALEASNVHFRLENNRRLIVQP